MNKRAEMDGTIFDREAHSMIYLMCTSVRMKQVHWLRQTEMLLNVVVLKVFLFGACAPRSNTDLDSIGACAPEREAGHDVGRRSGTDNGLIEALRKSYQLYHKCIDTQNAIHLLHGAT